MLSSERRDQLVRFGAVCIALAMGLVANQACGAKNPFAPTETTSNDTVTWRKRGVHLWKLDDAPLRPVVGEVGRTGGLVCGKKLISFAPDGEPYTNVVTLSKSYAFIGLRPKYIVAVTAAPAVLEILHRESGQEMRRVPLGEGEPLSLQLHPVLPVAYVSLSRTKTFPEGFSVKGFFATVDETSVEVRHSDEHLGQTLVIDPSGRFLIAGFSDSIPIGSEVVRIPGGMQPRGMSPVPPMRPNPYTPSPGRPQPRVGPYGPQPLPGHATTPDRVQVITKSAVISFALLFDLEDEHVPKCLGLFEFKGFQHGLRLSYDGRRLTGLDETPGLEARDPLNPKTATTTYDAGLEGRAANAELSHHPAMPVSIVAVADKLAFCDTTTGKPLPEDSEATLPYGTEYSDRTLSISPDGRYAMSAVRKTDGESRLVRVAIPLSTENRTRLYDRAATKSPSAISGTPAPLTKLDALRGGLASPLRTSEITKRYSSSVVVVRSMEGSGTGFVVGSSGYILTCAHCVSRLMPTVVAYRTTGGAGEEVETEVEAEVVQRDSKLDLALLKIKTIRPMSAVVLAPPVETAHGEEVTVIANPVLGDTILKNTITTGVVSNPKQQVEDDVYIQSSAAVNPGSSGGPMFDQHGRVVGMVVLKGRIEGVGFAIPSSRITEFLLHSATFAGDDGNLIRAWLDQAEKSEREGAFVKADDEKLTLLEASNPMPQALDIAQLSNGDRAFLKLVAAALSKK